MKILQIVPKNELSEIQLTYIASRISDLEHLNDTGPPSCWHTYTNGLYAAIEESTGNIIGLIEASGPKDCIGPGWWVDSKFRGKGFGKALVFALVKYLKQRGYYGVGHISIQTYLGLHDAASQKLKEYFIQGMTQ